MTIAPVWIIARTALTYHGHTFRAGEWLQVAPIDAAVLTYTSSSRRKVADLAPRGATPPPSPAPVSSSADVEPALESEEAPAVLPPRRRTYRRRDLTAEDP